MLLVILKLLEFFFQHQIACKQQLQGDGKAIKAFGTKTAKCNIVNGNFNLICSLSLNWNVCEGNQIRKITNFEKSEFFFLFPFSPSTQITILRCISIKMSIIINGLFFLELPRTFRSAMVLCYL